MSFGFDLLAFATGALTGLVETLSRYRDEPFKALAASFFGWFYVVLNGALALAAYYILQEQAPIAADAGGIEYLKYALAAGLGAAVIIRSRVFSTRIGDRDVAIGPGYIVDQLLLILDRQIDRQRALVRTRLVKARMASVAFQRVAAYVSTMILGSRQSMSLQDQEDLANQFKQIQAQPTGEREKAFALGFLILDFMGEEFLDELVDRIDTLDLGGMKASLTVEAPTPVVDKAKLVKSLLTGVSFADARGKLEQALKASVPSIGQQKKGELEQAIRKIDAAQTTPQLKSYDLGFAIIDSGGGDFLKQIFGPPPSEAEPGSPLPEED